MKLKKFIFLLMVVFLLYIVLFFSTTPLYMWSISKQWIKTGEKIQKIDKLLYGSWLHKTPYLMKLRGKYNIYWCHKFDSCDVKQ